MAGLDRRLAVQITIVSCAPPTPEDLGGSLKLKNTGSNDGTEDVTQ